MCMFFACVCLSIAGCSDDDDDGGGIGSGNTTDIAVTGKVTDITSSGATITGYININPALALLVQDFGVEYSISEDFSYSQYYAEVPGYTGREFSLRLRDLKPNTTYYYRTYVYQQMYYYGKTMSFTTEDVEFTVSDISYTRATLHYPYPGIETSTLYYSTSADGPFYKYEYWDGRQVRDEVYTDGFVMEGLNPNTTYYCYFVGSGQRFETISFKTKALPFNLSETSVKCTYYPTYNSYRNRYGQTVDLKWLTGKYTVNITSNAGNQYKYGILAVYGYTEFYAIKSGGTYIEDYLHYSTNTSSPYTVEVTGYRAWEIERIEVLLELVNNWDATDDDYDLLDALIDEAKDAPRPYVQAFIEIDGERVYVGSVYSID